MANVLLIRHGQASFGAADYDKLSLIGEEQSRRLGAWLKHTGETPDLIATGPLRRHVRTADLCVEAASVDAPRIIVPGLEEFDHEEVLVRHRPDLVSPETLVAELGRSADPHRAFQRMFVAAVARWTSGEFDVDYTRSWSVFRDTVMESLRELVAHDARTIWAFTSGGPIAVIVNSLVGAPIGQAFALGWPLVNTSITRISVDARRSELISYNAWPHLEGASETDLITHR